MYLESTKQFVFSNIEQELALFLSSNFPHVLLPALPFAFISPGENIITSHALKIANGPIEVQLTKLYWKPHIEEIKRQYREVLELGSASAEEWVKGLESQGRERLNDVARWEQWEAKGGLIKVNLRPSSKARSFALKQAPVTSSSAHAKPKVHIIPGLPTSSHVIPPGLPVDGHALLAQSPPSMYMRSIRLQGLVYQCSLLTRIGSSFTTIDLYINPGPWKSSAASSGASTAITA